MQYFPCRKFERGNWFDNLLSAQNKIYLVGAVRRGGVTQRVTALLQSNFQQYSSRPIGHTKHKHSSKTNITQSIINSSFQTQLQVLVSLSSFQFLHFKKCCQFLPSHKVLKSEIYNSFVKYRFHKTFFLDKSQIKNVINCNSSELMKREQNRQLSTR